MESPFILLSIKMATKQLFDEGKLTAEEHHKAMELVTEADSLRNRFINTTQELDEFLNEINQAMEDRKAELEEANHET